MKDMTVIVSVLVMALSVIAIAVAYFVGGDPIGGSDPRVCSVNERILSDDEIVGAALEMLIANQLEPALSDTAPTSTDAQPRISYPNVTALRAADPHIRFNSNFHWTRWQEDAAYRRALYRAGRQYRYTVTVAYRAFESGNKPIAVETFELDECAAPFYQTAFATSRGTWSVSMLEEARNRDRARLR
ncbi:MAG: hypothetical protein AAFU49_20990 [Pseudomonadota bacterium]